jgi:hypothetical protein
VTWERCEPYECYPGSEAWGRSGWTYTNWEDAKAKYDLLNDPAFKVSAPPIYPVRARIGISQDASETNGITRTAGRCATREKGRVTDEPQHFDSAENGEGG